MITRIDRWSLGGRKHRVEKRHVFTDPWQVLCRRIVEIVKTKQTINVQALTVEHVSPIKCQQACGHDIDSGAAKNPRLHRNVVLVYGLNGGAGLHLDEIEAATGAALQHIDPNQYAPVLECCFENCRNGLVGQ